MSAADEHGARRVDAELVGWAASASRLREALDRDELTLYCQPIAALNGPVRFPMAEVLVRLREEEKAMLPPGEFLPVFEHYRLMPDLDRWVVRKVVQHIAAGSLVPRFAVNVSSQTLEDAGFAAAVAHALQAHAVPGAALLFEIAESDTLARLESSVKFATAIRAAGCGVVVSGFGQRSASFQALNALRPDLVKIDGVVTRKVLASPSSEPKLKAILRVAEVMQFATVAEMVEDQDVLVRIKALGVQFAQGFGIRQPHALELISSRQARAKPA